MQVCRGWQHRICSAGHWRIQIITVRRVRAPNVPEQPGQQTEDVLVAHETWKQKLCLFKEAKGSSERNKVMLFSPSFLLCSD